MPRGLRLRLVVLVCVAFAVAFRAKILVLLVAALQLLRRPAGIGKARRNLGRFDGDLVLVDVQVLEAAHMLERVGVKDFDRTRLGVRGEIRVGTVKLALSHDPGVEMHQRIFRRSRPHPPPLAGGFVVLGDDLIANCVETMLIDRDPQATT